MGGDFESRKMDFLFRGLNDDSHLEMHRCPFLRNINEPTNFSFSSSLPFPMPVRAGKGPIFEDGPNFDMAFRLFHGRDGVVPLSERSLSLSEKQPQAALPFRNEKKNGKSSKKGPSPQGNSSHEALSEEWLENGNCPIAKSYRAVGAVLPLVAKVLQPPAGMKLKCPPAVVAARAAIAKTAFAKNLRPQPLPAKVFIIGMLGMAVNIPLGVWREHTKKFSVSWFAAVHAAVPFIGMLRKSVLMPKSAMAFTIAASVLGQVIGSRAERYRLKAIAANGGPMKPVAAKEVPLDEETSSTSSSQLGIVAVNGGHCGDPMGYPLSLQIAGTTSPTDREGLLDP
ncbi:hypothetical protein Tsubulata_020256 [Turnera subulata]|uniref:Uncharacterized protein n=1 Tax=Turnera subulata TaxID=218843 RepID=A0A9Q0GHC9_9ROSI|nr:hypothetical protein Tsubulata_020256 [Turnera subulata]